MALWLVPLLLTLHNVEEALFLSQVLPVVSARIPPVLQDVLPRITYPQFLVALLIVTVVPYGIALLGDLERKGSQAVYLLLVVQAVILLNVFSHLATAVVLVSYAPGLVTAVAINLPFSIYLFRRARREQWVNSRALLLLVPLALVLHGPGLLGLMILSEQVAHILVSVGSMDDHFVTVVKLT